MLFLSLPDISHGTERLDYSPGASPRLEPKPSHCQPVNPGQVALSWICPSVNRFHTACLSGLEGRLARGSITFFCLYRFHPFEAISQRCQLTGPNKNLPPDSLHHRQILLSMAVLGWGRGEDKAKSLSLTEPDVRGGERDCSGIFIFSCFSFLFVH